MTFSKSPMVSVIIPTFNRAALIERALRSVASQTYGNYEIIVVDDGSTDETTSVLANWQKNPPAGVTTTVLYQKQAGVSAARNAGVQQSQGEWLAFLDSDDEWLPNKLAAQLSYASRYPSLSLIHGEELWIRQGVRVNPGKKYKKAGGWIFPKALELCAISPSTVLVKKDYFLKFKGFREDYPVCEDYHLWLKMTGSDPVGLVDEPVVKKYAGHGDQLSFAYKAMDFYRVKAIDEILDEGALPVAWKVQAVRALDKKCGILLNGYVKHNNMDGYEQVLAIRNRWCRKT